MNDPNDLRMKLREVLKNLWKRLNEGLSGLDTRVTALEQRVAALDGQSASSNTTNNETEG